MATRTSITVQDCLLNNDIDIVTTTAAAAEMEYLNDGKTALFIYNEHATNTTITTVYSVADGDGRTGNLSTTTTAAGDYGIVGLLEPKYWNQGGKVLIDLDNVTDVYVAAVRFGTAK